MLVMIDPGHGGHKPGAMSNNGTTAEKDVAFLYSQYLSDRLRHMGFDAKLTRYADVHVGLTERAQLANNAGADCFVSVHCNSCEHPNTATGFEVFHYPVSIQGKALAESINDAWEDEHQVETRGVKSRDNLTVLRRTNMPAVLLEIGFINNDIDLAEMLDVFWMRKSILAIQGGLIDWEMGWTSRT